jgi:hypothetical protein
MSRIHQYLPPSLPLYAVTLSWPVSYTRCRTQSLHAHIEWLTWRRHAARSACCPRGTKTGGVNQFHSIFVSAMAVDTAVTGVVLFMSHQGVDTMYAGMLAEVATCELSGSFRRNVTSRVMVETVAGGMAVHTLPGVSPGRGRGHLPS